MKIMIAKTSVAVVLMMLLAISPSWAGVVTTPGLVGTTIGLCGLAIGATAATMGVAAPVAAVGCAATGILSALSVIFPF